MHSSRRRVGRARRRRPGHRPRTRLVNHAGRAARAGLSRPGAARRGACSDRVPRPKRRLRRVAGRRPPRQADHRRARRSRGARDGLDARPASRAGRQWLQPADGRTDRSWSRVGVPRDRPVGILATQGPRPLRHGARPGTHRAVRRGHRRIPTRCTRRARARRAARRGSGAPLRAFRRHAAPPQEPCGAARRDGSTRRRRSPDTSWP